MIRPPQPTLTERFWRLFERDTATGCWNWTGVQVTGGYGRFTNDRKMLAHRFAYELLVGPIGEGLTLDHLCRNTRCVNPAHLEEVEMVDNVRRALPHRDAPVKHGPAVIAEVRRLRAEDHTIRKVQELTGVDASYVSRVCRGLARSGS